MSPANGLHAQGCLGTSGPGGGQQACGNLDTSSPRSSVGARQDTVQHREAGAAACRSKRLLLHSQP